MGSDIPPFVGEIVILFMSLVITMINKIRAVFDLIRFELPLAAGICVVVGQTVALGSFAPVLKILQGFAFGFFLSASAMIFNDYFDIEVDRVNSPARPLPSGRIKPREAIFLGILTGGIAFLIAFSMAPAAFLAACLLWILGYFYNWKWKAYGLAGNLIVSLNVAMTFLVGAFSVGQIRNPAVWLFAGVAFLFDLGEEIAGDAMDIDGDRKRGSRSIAILYGRGTALKVSALVFGMMILLTLLPIIFSTPGIPYIVVILSFDLIVIRFTGRILKSRNAVEGRIAMRAMYLAATACVLAYILWINLAHIMANG